METTKQTDILTSNTMLKLAKSFTGYILALTIVVWGFTFALMYVWLVVASLVVAMFLGASLLLLLQAELVVRALE